MEVLREVSELKDHHHKELRDLRDPLPRDSKEISETRHKVLKEVKVQKDLKEDLVRQDLPSKEMGVIKDL
jgi:hypothetical protein